MKFLFSFYVCFLFLDASYAQIKSQQEIDKGNQYKKLYPDEEVCALTSIETYTFGIGRNDTVIAHKDVEERFLSLKDGASVSVVESYNHFSSVDQIRPFTTKGRSLSTYEVPVVDRAYFQSEIFDDDNRYKSFKFSFATLGEEKYYTLYKTYKDVKYLSTVFFNDYYPIEEKTIIVKVPDWLKLGINEFNFEGFDVKKTQSRDEKTKVTIYQYKLSHCIALKEEEDAPSTSFSWPHLLFVAQSFTDNTGANKKIFSSVDDLYAWYSYLVSKTNNDKTFLKTEADKIVAGKTTDLEKIKAIFYWVQDNIRYIAFEKGYAGYVPENADKVSKSKYGDCKGMANLTTSLLQAEGFDARLAWIGTRDIPYDYSIPSIVVDNHMICALVIKDSIYFLDGTENYISLGDYAYRIQGKPALIQDGKKYMIKKVPDLPKERNKREFIYTMKLEGNDLKGIASSTYNGESKVDIMREYSTTKSDRKDELLQYIANHGDKNLITTNLKTSDLNDRDVAVHLDYNFVMQNRVTDADAEKYVSIDFSQDFEDKMPDNKRQNDYIFYEKVFRIYTSEFEIPAGLKVKYMPQPLNINTPDYKFNVSYEQKGNKVILKKILSIDNGIIKKSLFEQWKKDLKELKNMSAEQLVLIKK